MGMFGKLKSIFYDEEIVEEEIPEVKKEVVKEVREIKKEQPIVSQETSTRTVEPKIEQVSERDLFKSEPTFKFPVFEEEDFAPVTKTRSETSKNVMEYEKRRENILKEEKKTVSVEEKTFRPSPVISPIYGILDKNYKKEEVRETINTTKREPRETTVDYVRKKAFGTLATDLEDTLKNLNADEIVEEIEDTVETIDKTKTNIESLLNEIEENTKVSIGELEEAFKEKMDNEEKTEEIIIPRTRKLDDSFDTDEFKLPKHEEIEKADFEDTDTLEIPVQKEKEEKRERTIDELGDKTLEHDLFNLIDSMYDDKEEEE